MKQNNIATFSAGKWIARRACNLLLLVLIFLLVLEQPHYLDLVIALFFIAIGYNILYSDYKIINGKHHDTAFNRIYFCIYLISFAILIVCIVGIPYMKPRYNTLYVEQFANYYLASYLFLPPLGGIMPRREKQQTPATH